MVRPLPHCRRFVKPPESASISGWPAAFGWSGAEPPGHRIEVADYQSRGLAMEIYKDRSTNRVRQPRDRLSAPLAYATRCSASWSIERFL
jgi:hypothetical protein